MKLLKLSKSNFSYQGHSVGHIYRNRDSNFSLQSEVPVKKLKNCSFDSRCESHKILIKVEHYSDSHSRNNLFFHFLNNTIKSHSKSFKSF